MELAPDFDEFCALLIAHRVDFAIIGAYALAFHGAPRFTGHLEILIAPTEANGDRLLKAIDAFGFPTAPLTAAELATGTKLIEMGVPPVQIHVMSQIDGVTSDEVWNTRQTGPLGRHTVAFIGRDTFLRNKRAAGRQRDLADVEALRDAGA